MKITMIVMITMTTMNYDDLAIVSNSIPEKPKAESPSTHRTRAPGSYFLGKEFEFKIAWVSKYLNLNLNSQG